MSIGRSERLVGRERERLLLNLAGRAMAAGGLASAEACLRRAQPRTVGDLSLTASINEALLELLAHKGDLPGLAETAAAALATLARLGSGPDSDGAPERGPRRGGRGRSRPGGGGGRAGAGAGGGRRRRAAARVRRRGRRVRKIIHAGQAGYDGARRVWNGAVDRRPALIVRPCGTPDLAAAIGLARDGELPLAVRGGGHSIAVTRPATAAS